MKYCAGYFLWVPQLHSLPFPALLCAPGIWPWWTPSHRCPVGFRRQREGRERNQCHSSFSSSPAVLATAAFLFRHNSLQVAHLSPLQFFPGYNVPPLYLLRLRVSSSPLRYTHRHTHIPWSQSNWASRSNSQITGNMSHRGTVRQHNKEASSQIQM